MKLINEIISIKKVIVKSDKTDFMVFYPEPCIEMIYIDDECVARTECFADMEALLDFLTKSKLLTAKVVIQD